MAKAKPTSNVYTILVLVAALVLAAGVGFVAYRANELFGDLFSLSV